MNTVRVGPLDVSRMLEGARLVVLGGTGFLGKLFCQAAALDRFARNQEKVDQILTMFEPFVTRMNGPFDCSNVRAAHARLSDTDSARLPWAPEAIGWADWTMNVHMPAMEKRIIPEIDRRVSKRS